MTHWSLGRRFALLLTALYLTWAFLLLSNFDGALLHRESLDQAFTDSARRLLHWDFSVSPSAIDYEAFVRDHRTYMYFGIFPVLLRLPFVAAGLATEHVSRISCLAALGIFVFHVLRLFQGAFARLSPGPGDGAIVSLVLLSAVLTGPQIYLLASATIYHEVIFWAAALCAVFSYVVLRRWLTGAEATFADLLALAVIAGLCLVDRVAEGLGLYAALLFLLIRAFFRDVVRAGPNRWSAFREIIAAGCLSLVFVACLGLVDWERWGDPLVTSPFNDYIQMQNHPEWLQIYARHGLFSLYRVMVALLYFGTGAKIETVLPDAVPNYYGYIEGPRSLVIANEPLTFLLLAVGVAVAFRRPAAHSRPLLLLLGQSLGVLVILGFSALAMRYTFSFWGPMMAVAPLGAAALGRTGRRNRIVPAALAGLLLVGIAGSHITLLRYKLVSVGTDPVVRYDLSRILQPIVCPRAPIDPAVKTTDFLPLVTPSCPPLW